MMQPGPVRTEFDPAEIGSSRFYRLLTAVVVPRPIAWVSTTSADGVDNLAPHSFFTITSVKPPIVQFTSTGDKDSVRNARATGEFVVSFSPEPLFELVNATGTDFPPHVSEFDECGIAREPSKLVRPPRVAASPVALECRVHTILPVGDSVVVMGEVVYAAVATDTLDGEHPDIERLRPLSRLGRNEWGISAGIRELDRFTVDAWNARGHG